MKRSKKIILLMSAFLIPILIVVINLIYMEIKIPGYFSKGENLLLADMSSQYNSLYSYIQDVYIGKASIFFSFSKSLGGNMASTVGYYLASPFNILYLFFNKESIPLCTFIIYLLKIGLCGLFMNIFLQKRLKTNNWKLIIFSTFYALCAYTVNYYFNNMWLDVVLMTPLVMYGINYIIENKKIYLYTIFLSIAIISNFYISYMLCIFCVIYFLFEIIIRFKLKNNFKEIKKIILKFIIGSLLAGGISCILLLPALTNLSEVMRFKTNPNQLKYDMRGLKNTIFNDILSKLYIGSHSKESTLSRNRPNLYFGILPLVLCYFYYFNKKIKLKEKILSFLITFLFFISFFIPVINIFWHAFSFPNGYICRFSYLFCFFMIFIACRNLIKLDKIKIIPSIIFIGLYIWMSTYISKQYLVFLEKKDIIISCVFVIIYIITLFILSRIKKGKIVLSIILFIAAIIEIYLNFSDCLITNQKMKIITSYSNFYNDVCPQINDIENDFYRIDGNYYFSYLDSMICRTKSLTSSLSTNDGKLYKSLYDYGYSITYTTVSEDVNKLPVMDSLLGIKYYYSKDEFNDTLYTFKDKIYTTKYNYVEKDWKEKIIYLYENPYALNLGFMVDNNYPKIYKKGNFDNNYEYLNSLFKAITGNNEDIFHEYSSNYLGNNQYIFSIDNDSKYLYLSYKYPISINWTSYESIYINNEYVETGNSDDVGIIKVPNKYNNQDIVVRIGYDNYSYTNTVVDSLVMYSFNQEQFVEDINILKQNQIKLIKMDKNELEANVDVKDKKILFLSIPYDKGWSIKVDGKKTNYFNIGHGFIGLELSEGKHNIKMKYVSPNFYKGCIISLISIILLILYESKNKRK